MCALALAALVPASAQALPSSTPDAGAFQANDDVLSVARDGGITLIGGKFTELSARTGPGVRFNGDGRRAAPVAEVTGGAGQVFASAPDGTGGYFLGGDFDAVGGLPRSNIAHVLASGRVDPAFDPAANGVVRALAVSGGVLYAGGAFSSIGDRARSGIAKLSTTNGGAYSTWNPNATGGDVLALAVSGSTVYAGGTFTNIGGLARARVAKLSTTSGGAFGSFQANAPNGSVLALAVSSSGGSGGTAVQSDLYVGGTFTDIGGRPRNRIAKLSTANGGAFSTWNPNANSTVTALVVNTSADFGGAAVFAGGEFNGPNSIGGADRDYLAKLSPTSGGAFSAWNPQPDAGVRALTFNGTLFVGGFFENIGGRPRNGIAELSTRSGAAYSGFDPNIDAPASAPVRTISLLTSSIFAGGDFTTVNAVQRNHIAALDPSGAPIAWNPNANEDVVALAAADGFVYAAGPFTAVGGQLRNGLARISGLTGNAVSTWNPNPDAPVTSLAVSGMNVYAAGTFTTIGGQSRDGLAKLSIANGNAFADWDATPDGPVNAFALSGDDVFVGGSFNAIGGQTPRNGIAKLSATTGAADTTFNPNATGGDVLDLAINGTDLFAGGTFTNIGGQPRNRIAKLSAVSGNAFMAFNPNADGLVRALAVSGSSLYAAGDFTTIGGQGRTGLALLSGASGNAFQGFDPVPNGIVRDLAASGPGGSGSGAAGSQSQPAATSNTAYAGGSFTTVGGAPRRGFAQFTAP